MASGYHSSLIHSATVQGAHDSVTEQLSQEAAHSALFPPHRRPVVEAKSMHEAAPLDRSPSLGHSHDHEWATPSSWKYRFSVVLFAVTSVLLACAANRWSDQLSAELKMLRGSFLIVLLLYLFLLNIRGWRAGNIAYVKMFDLDSDWMVFNSMLGISMQAGLLWSIGTILTLTLSALNWNTLVSYAPLAVWLVLTFYFISPAKSYFYESRMWMVNVLYRILVSPLYEVSFADFWVADQLNSLAQCFLDFEYSVCFLVSLSSYSVSQMKGIPAPACAAADWGPRLVLTCLPAWWRFAQCLRCYYDSREIHHLLNAGKYFSTFPMIATTGLLIAAQREHQNDWRSRPEFTIWFICTFLRAIYVYVWDIKMDWGFCNFANFPCNPFKSKNPFLRYHLLFSRRWMYYGMIVLDLVLRFTFLTKLYPVVFGIVPGQIFFTFLATLEVVRRFLWNFFRLEYEQTKGMPTESPTKINVGGAPDFLHDL